MLSNLDGAVSTAFRMDGDGGWHTLFPCVDVVSRGIDVEADGVTELPLEVVHSENTVHVSGIESEEDTTEGSETTEHVAPGRDGRLNTTEISGHCD